MTLKDELPHDPEAAHALIRQKLNELWVRPYEDAA